MSPAHHCASQQLYQSDRCTNSNKITGFFIGCFPHSVWHIARSLQGANQIHLTVRIDHIGRVKGLPGTHGSCRAISIIAHISQPYHTHTRTQQIVTCHEISGTTDQTVGPLKLGFTAYACLSGHAQQALPLILDYPLAI